MNDDDASADATPAHAGERLHKVLAAAGIGSRRHCEELITAGRVQVDGEVVTTLGVRVDPLQHRIAVDTVDIPRPRLEYYLVNKPTGVVCTNFDPDGRTRVIDLLPPDAKRVYTVGRLDRNSEGLVLLTNDGELANRLMHPRFEVSKVYDVQVAGEAGQAVADQLLQGVRLAEGVARASNVQIKSSRGRSTVLRITLKEGKNREIRRLLARTGHKVMQLRRVALGPLKLHDMPPGQFRRLHEAEVRQLQLASTGSHTDDNTTPDAAENRPQRPQRPPREQRRGGTRRPPFEVRRQGQAAQGRPARKPPGKPRGAARPLGKPPGRRPAPVAGMGTIIGGDEESAAAVRPRGKRPRPATGAPAGPRGKRPRPVTGAAAGPRGKQRRAGSGSGRFRDEQTDGRVEDRANDRAPAARKFTGKKFAGKKDGAAPSEPGKFSGKKRGAKKFAAAAPGERKFAGKKPGGKKSFGKKPRRGRPG